ncbi:MAG: 50S ribosomal protein L29 [Candidatus Micrarchaeia archaeon]
MAILRKSDVRALETGALVERLGQLKSELNRETGLVKTGGRATNPGRIRELRRTVSRILTIIHERKLGIKKDVKDKKKAKPAEKKAAEPAKKEQAEKTVSAKEKEVK